jgi:hypothetical protein
MPANTTQSPELAPEYALHREGVAVVDVIANVAKTQGMNMATYERAHIQVIPSGGADPTVRVHWWSEEAGRFVVDKDYIAVAGEGANTPYEFTVNCRGRRMFVAITVLAGGTANVRVSGFRTQVQPTAG